MPSRVSAPFSSRSSGKRISMSPVCSKSSRPTEGRGDRRILLNSVEMRSAETILMRSLLRPIAAKVSGSMKKPNCEAKRIARIMRRGSSLKVTPGSRGVRRVKLSISSSPSKGSTSSPKRSAFRQRARALMVKSRRSWSSCSVPSSTKGLRLSGL